MAGPAGALTADLHSLHNVLLYSPSFLGHQLCAWVGVEVGPRSPRHSPRHSSLRTLAPACHGDSVRPPSPGVQRSLSPQAPAQTSPVLEVVALNCSGLICPPGEGNGNPLQCSCLENPRDGGAWWAAVYGIAQSRRRLKGLSSICPPHWTVNAEHNTENRPRDSASVASESVKEENSKEAVIDLEVPAQPGKPGTGRRTLGT